MTQHHKHRCSWVDDKKEDYVRYHDEEWGVPVHCDKKMFEFIILESAQAGLNWYTILKKRTGYKKAFANFDVNVVANYNDNKIDELMQDAAIVRNRLKINAAITNAIAFIQIQKEFGSFANYIWQYVDNKPIVNNIKSLADCPATSSLSDIISKDLKKRGFKFFGSTICYAFLQACGLINDHFNGCFRKTLV